MLTDLPYFATAEKYFDIGVIDMIARLVAATVIGMLIGLNRDVNGKPTGMRTLALVSLGAAVVAVVAHDKIMGFADYFRTVILVAAKIGRYIVIGKEDFVDVHPPVLNAY